MKNFLGNTIEIGDTIVYADTGGRGGSSTLYKTVVTKMTEKQVLVGESSWSKLWRPFNRVVVVAKGGVNE